MRAAPPAQREAERWVSANRAKLADVPDTTRPAHPPPRVSEVSAALCAKRSPSGRRDWPHDRSEAKGRKHGA